MIEDYKQEFVKLQYTLRETESEKQQLNEQFKETNELLASL